MDSPTARDGRALVVGILIAVLAGADPAGALASHRAPDDPAAHAAGGPPVAPPGVLPAVPDPPAAPEATDPERGSTRGDRGRARSSSLGVRGGALVSPAARRALLRRIPPRRQFRLPLRLCATGEADPGPPTTRSIRG